MNRIFAIPAAVPATPPKPRMPAMRARIRNVSDQLNMVLFFPCRSYGWIGRNPACPGRLYDEILFVQRALERVDRFFHLRCEGSHRSRVGRFEIAMVHQAFGGAGEFFLSTYTLFQCDS